VNCVSEDSECSIARPNALRQPQIYPLEHLYAYPLNLAFMNTIDRISTMFMNRLIEWVRAGQLK
jgi:hypothetical protein